MLKALGLLAVKSSDEEGSPDDHSDDDSGGGANKAHGSKAALSFITPTSLVVGDVCEVLRFSLAHYNDVRDVDRLIAFLRSIGF